MQWLKVDSNLQTSGYKVDPRFATSKGKWKSIQVENPGRCSFTEHTRLRISFNPVAIDKVYRTLMDYS